MTGRERPLIEANEGASSSMAASRGSPLTEPPSRPYGVAPSMVAPSTRDIMHRLGIRESVAQGINALAEARADAHNWG
jgi:hypothetical protein